MITIITTLPPPLNQAYRSNRKLGGVYMTAEGKAWKEATYWLAKGQMTGKKPTTKPVSMEINMYCKWDRDWDSSLKLMSDALEGAIYENDKQVNDVHIRKFKDKSEPRIEIKIL